MSFHSPHLLWLLVPLVLLFSWELARHTARTISNWPKIPRAWAGAFEVSLGAHQAAKTDTRTRLCLWFGLAFCVVALARPQWGVIEEQVFEQSREVIISVDLSRSMLAQDVKPSRLDRSKLLIQSLLDNLKGERVGLMMFAGTAFLQSPLSADYEILREFLPSMNPDYLPEGGSDYKAMLETAIQAFGTTDADRYLIILSDGESTTEGWQALAETLKTKGIRVIGLGVGTAQGSFIPDAAGGLVKDERGAVVMSRLNSSTLEELARMTEGAYTDASNWVDLAGLLRNTVEAGQKGEFSEKNTARMIERFQWFLAPGVLLLLLSFWTEFPVRPRERALPIRRNTPPRIPQSKVAALGAFAAFLALAIGTTPLPAQSPEAAADPNAFAKPLSTLVGRLADKQRSPLRDYVELAQTTLTYGERLKSSQQPIPENVIYDGLHAIDAGEKLDPKATDWPLYRKELEALLEKQDQSEDQEQPQQDKNEEQDKQDQQKNDQQQQNEQQQPSSDQEQQQQQQGDQQDQNQQSEKNDQQQGQPQQDAFGDMKDDKDPQQKDEQPPQPPEQPQSGTQKVGGQPDRRPEGEQQDPSLAIPLQKLEQVRNQDSPAKLQQLLQGQQKQPASKGKDW